MLVTGASSGIGRGVVTMLCDAGYEVHAMARRAERLADLVRLPGCRTHVADMTDIASLAEVVQIAQPGVLINNAGRGTGLDGLANQSRKDVAETVETNVLGLLHLTGLVLTGMSARRRGHIVNIGSVAALYPSQMSVYGGTKAAVRLLGENLRLELRGTGIRVTDIRPGRVRTEFYNIAISDAVEAARVKETGIRDLSAEDVGAAVLYAISAPQHVNVSTIELQPTEQSYGGTQFDPV